MDKALTLYDTTIGKKAVMAVTGLVLFGFVIGHMIGNLQLYMGPAQLNHYAHTLKSLPELLWAVRIVLAVSVVLHITATVQLYDRTLAAREKRYRVKKSIAATYASKTMIWTGPTLLLFIVYHLVHFTIPGVSMGNYVESATNVYANVVNGFSIPWVAAIYIVGNLALGYHLYHGGVSLLQTLGFNHPRHNDRARGIARAFALIVTLGNISFPISVLLGIIR